MAHTNPASNFHSYIAIVLYSKKIQIAQLSRNVEILKSLCGCFSTLRAYLRMPSFWITSPAPYLGCRPRPVRSRPSRSNAFQRCIDYRAGGRSLSRCAARLIASKMRGHIWIKGTGDLIEITFVFRLCITKAEILPAPLSGRGLGHFRQGNRVSVRESRWSCQLIWITRLRASLAAPVLRSPSD